MSDANYSGKCRLSQFSLPVGGELLKLQTSSSKWQWLERIVADLQFFTDKNGAATPFLEILG